MNNLQVRAITGVVFVSSLVLSIALGPWTFFVMFALITGLAMHEFYNLAEKAGSKPQRWLGIFSGVYLFSSLFLYIAGYSSMRPTLGLIPLVCFMFIAELYRKSETPFQDLAFTIMGLLYIAAPISLFNFFVFPQAIGDFGPTTYSPNILIGLFVFIWANDSGAYMFGSTFGKRRLFERISPKKSWEGSIGGGFTAVVIAAALSYVFPEVGMAKLIGVALITAIAANFGDLIESMFKRSIDVKDSGSIFPGHGGFLDRFDSILLASPFVYFFLRILA